MAGSCTNCRSESRYRHLVVPDYVLRQSVLPTGQPPSRPRPGPRADGRVIGATVPVFGIVGAVVWYRRHPGEESWMVWAYFAETLAYPYNNQRRVILVLPLVTIWYVVGAAAVGHYVLSLGGRTLSRVAASVVVLVAVLVAGVPTAAGFTRDYLYNVGQKSYEFARSPAMSLLKAIGPSSAVVETDYRGSVAFFSDHRTAWTAFTLDDALRAVRHERPERRLFGCCSEERSGG